MGCQISAGKLEINYSRGAWLVAEMCQPWFDPVRDCDSDGHHQDMVAATSLKAAAAELPDTLSDYLVWAANKGIERFSFRDEVTESDYAIALKFVREVAALDRDAYLSH